jgi:hypothetical protein
MISVDWRPRAVPLEPAAIVADAGVARALARRVLDDGKLPRLTGVSADGWLVLIGEAEDLPWVDGVRYAGRDPRAPALFVPTAIEPSVPLTLFERALLRSFAIGVLPLVVLPEEKRVLSCAEARMVSRERLAAWLEQGA